MQREFLAAVAEVRAAGRTVFLSSHNLPEVERSCDRVGIIRDGRLAEIATVQALQAGHWRSVNLVLAQSVAPVDTARPAVAGPRRLGSGWRGPTTARPARCAVERPGSLPGSILISIAALAPRTTSSGRRGVLIFAVVGLVGGRSPVLARRRTSTATGQSSASVSRPNSIWGRSARWSREWPWRASGQWPPSTYPS